MTKPVHFTSGEHVQTLTCHNGVWRGQSAACWSSEFEAALHLCEALHLTAEIPHDSQNILVGTAYDIGTITSRGYPPWHWGYEHGRHLPPETTAAATLDTPKSFESLRWTLARWLARVRILGERSKKLLKWPGPSVSDGCSPSSLAMAASLDAAAREIERRLSAVYDPFDEMYGVVRELNALGHDFSSFDEDGGSYQAWLSSRYSLALSTPDFDALAGGGLADLDEDTGVFIDTVQVRLRRGS